MAVEPRFGGLVPVEGAVVSKVAFQTPLVQNTLKIVNFESYVSDATGK